MTGHRASEFKVGPTRLGATGWEFVHVCGDDATRLAYAEVLPDEKGPTAAGFLRRAVSWLASMGIEVKAVMSDNGACRAAQSGGAAGCERYGAPRRVAVRGPRARRVRAWTQIVPLLIGKAGDAMALCDRLLPNRLFAQAIRPPTVPPGTSRLRLTTMATTGSRTCGGQPG